jgi:hypothetical protein
LAATDPGGNINVSATSVQVGAVGSRINLSIPDTRTLRFQPAIPGAFEYCIILHTIEASSLTLNAVVTGATDGFKVFVEHWRSN